MQDTTLNWPLSLSGGILEVIEINHPGGKKRLCTKSPNHLLPSFLTLGPIAGRSSRSLSWILSLVRFWKVSLGGWYLNLENILSKEPDLLSCQVPASVDNFPPQRANWEMSSQDSRLRCGMSRTVACCFPLLCCLFWMVEDTSQARVVHWTSETRRQGCL